MKEHQNVPDIGKKDRNSSRTKKIRTLILTWEITVSSQTLFTHVNKIDQINSFFWFLVSSSHNRVKRSCCL